MSVVDSMSLPNDDAPVLEAPGRSRRGKYNAKEVGLALSSSCPRWPCLGVLLPARPAQLGHLRMVGRGVYNPVGLDQYKDVLAATSSVKVCGTACSSCSHVPAGRSWGRCWRWRTGGSRASRCSRPSSRRSPAGCGLVGDLLLPVQPGGRLLPGQLAVHPTWRCRRRLPAICRTGLAFVIVLGTAAVPDEVMEAARLTARRGAA